MKLSPYNNDIILPCASNDAVDALYVPTPLFVGVISPFHNTVSPLFTLTVITCVGDDQVEPSSVEYDITFVVDEPLKTKVPFVFAINVRYCSE